MSNDATHHLFIIFKHFKVDQESYSLSYTHSIPHNKTLYNELSIVSNY